MRAAGELQLALGGTLERPRVDGRAELRRIFLDSLLLIERGEPLKFRSGSYSVKAGSLTFGSKFHVLERTVKFDPAAFGVPLDAFRGFSGILQGEIVEGSYLEGL